MNNQNLTRSYTIGYILSIIVTFGAYFLVINQTFSGTALTFAILILAGFQLAVQLIYFLHIFKEKGSYNLAMVIATLGFILIVILGSLWIMTNLNYRHQTNQNPTQDYFLKDEGIKQ